MTLTENEVSALKKTAQRSNTILSSVSLTTDQGVLHAVHSAQIECFSVSEDGERFIFADQHGLMHVGYIPKLLGERQLCFDFEPRSFASIMGRIYADDYRGPSVDPYLMHYRGWRAWKHVALRNLPQMTFAAMDADGRVEIWKYHHSAWHRERVWQSCVCPVAGSDGREILEWEDADCLFMKDRYGRGYRFSRRGFLLKRWQQTPLKES